MRGKSFCWLLFLAVAGCGGGAGAELAALLPEPPAGWKFQEKGKHATIGEVGAHAWSVYVPAEGGDIEKAEVTLSKRAKEGSPEELKKLRRLESFEGQLVEQIKIGEFPATQSADFPSAKKRPFVLSVFVGKNVTVDIVLFPREDANFQVGARPKLARSFADGLKFSKLKKLVTAEP